MPKKIAGIWLPDDDKYLTTQLPMERVLDGAATFQYRKYKTAFPYIRGRRHAVDIGAHVGLWSRPFMRHFDRLTAFEPLTRNHECFLLNTADNPRGAAVILHKCALGDSPGTIRMEERVDTCYSHIDPSTGNTEVEIRTLDSFGLTNVDFLKIDCEGFEYYVLKGGEETIRRDKPFIIVEQKPRNGERYGLDWKAAITLLREWGATEAFNYSNDHGMYWNL